MQHEITSADVDYVVDQTVKLCRIPSPTGYTRMAEKYLLAELGQSRLPVSQTRKGSVLVDLGGEGPGLVLAAHVDTLGAMVRSIKSDGRLRLTLLGGFPFNNIEHENCVIHTRDGREYSGTIQVTKSSVHVHSEAVGKTERDDSTVEVVIDEKVSSKEETAKLGIRAGDHVSFDARTVVTRSGFIKSRHLDDKASAAVQLALARMVSQGRLKPMRKTWLLFTTYEEVGHGGSAGIPDGVEEMISVDMGAVGDDLGTDEYKVSICAKDSGGPYDYGVTTRLIELAEKLGLGYAVDIYPRYGSDVEATLRAGLDIRHGLIGPGVAASHGYERTHREGLENTLRLLAAYLAK
jgi:putative aminopeptidase FrvX